MNRWKNIYPRAVTSGNYIMVAFCIYCFRLNIIGTDIVFCTFDSAPKHFLNDIDVQCWHNLKWCSWSSSATNITIRRHLKNIFCGSSCLLLQSKSEYPSIASVPIMVTYCRYCFRLNIIGNNIIFAQTILHFFTLRMT